MGVGSRREEVRRSPALDVKPVVLEYPPPPPPASLADIHFGDPLGDRAILEDLRGPAPKPSDGRDLLEPAPKSDCFVLKIGLLRTSQLAPGMRIEREMLGPAGAEMGDPIGQVETIPHDPKRLGLRNRSARAWHAKLPTGEGTVQTGKAVQLTLGLVIDFAEIQGVVEAVEDRFFLKIGPLRTPALAPGMRLGPEILGISDPEGGGQFETSPHGPKALGLRNRSTRAWQAKLPNGQVAEVPPGKAVQLTPGLVIGFGKIQGVVEAAEPL